MVTTAAWLYSKEQINSEREQAEKLFIYHDLILAESYYGRSHGMEGK